MDEYICYDSQNILNLQLFTLCSPMDEYICYDSQNILNLQLFTLCSPMDEYMLRGVPTERRKPCDCRYRCIEMVCRSVGTLYLCDFCYF